MHCRYVQSRHDFLGYINMHSINPDSQDTRFELLFLREAKQVGKTIPIQKFNVIFAQHFQLSWFRSVTAI